MTAVGSMVSPLGALGRLGRLGRHLWREERTAASRPDVPPRPFPVITCGAALREGSPDIPHHIAPPCYATDNPVGEHVLYEEDKTVVWSQEEVDEIRNCCQISKRMLHRVEAMARVETSSSLTLHCCTRQD